MSRFLFKRFACCIAHTAVRRSVIGVAVLVLFFCIFGTYVLPLIIVSQAEKLAAEKLHRQLTIGRVALNPFALTLTLHDIKLREPGGAAAFVAFDALALNASIQSLWHLAPVIEEVRLTKPYLHLRRNDANHYNVDDIIALIASQPHAAGPARFSVNNIQIENGRIEFEDRPLNTTHAIADITLGVPFVSSLAADVKVFVEPLLSAKVNGTPLLLKGKARPFSSQKEAVVELNLEDIELARYLGYLPDLPRVKVVSALGNLHLSARFQQFENKAAALVLSGDAVLKSVQVLALDGKPLLKLPELTITLDKSDLFGSNFAIARVLINGLQADVTRSRDGRLSLAGLLPPSAPATPAHMPAIAPAAKPHAESLRFALGEVEIRDAALRYTDAQAAVPMRVTLEKFDATLHKIALDTGKRSVTIDALRSGSADFALLQGKSLPIAAAAPAADSDLAAKTPAQRMPGGKSEAPYTINVGTVKIDNWSARLEDRSVSKPLLTTIAPLSLTMQNLTTASSAPGTLELHAAINRNGQIGMRGTLGLTPVHAALALDLKNVDILALQPYITDKVNLLLTAANVSSQGALQLDQARNGAWRGGFKGDLTLGNVALVDKQSTNDFMRWKSLQLGGVDLRMEPFSIAVDRLALNDFFARVIINPDGRINLQDIVRSAAGEPKTLTESRPQPSAVSATSVAPAPAAAAAKMPPVTIRKFTLQGGKVRYTDNFIKPHYTANLMDLGGVVAGLSSDPSSSASVDLHGAVNSAPLAIAGRINPLKGDLSLDLKAHVRGMELAPLPAYSGRYVGYGIDKGKLSFEVAYQIENRTLTAQNRLILDQLRFGDKIDSPGATTLPVRFAVALLQDRNGVIDIDLPIGGSLDDPQFSMGGVIVKVIVNVLTKAVTEPFALLGSLFGGGAEMSSLEFEPGHAAIPAAGAAKLKSLAQALIDRPALKLEITGRADPEADRAGLQRAALERKVRALKLKDIAARGETAAADRAAVKPAEYPALLTRVYKEEKFTKPRNLIGLQKTLPVAEMEQAIMSGTAIGGDDLITLGNRRAEAVKAWLLKTGEVPDERIFIVAAKSGAQRTDAAGAGLPPGRVDFSLR